MDILSLKLSFVVGVLILLLLIFTEFRRRFSPYIKTLAPRTLLLFTTFAIINVVIYLLLCAFFLQMDPLGILKADVLPEEIRITGSLIFAPMFISVMYFGTGAVVIEVGKFKFGFYDKVLGYIEILLPPHIEQPDPNAVSMALEQYGEYQELLAKVHNLRTMAGAYEHWDSMEEEWNNSNIVPLNVELDNLASLLSKLKSTESRENIISGLNAKLTLALKELHVKVADYVYKFIVRNGKTVEDVKRIYEQGLECSTPDFKTVQPSRVKRALVLSATFGLLFGPIFALTRESAPSILYAIIGALALGAFGTILSVTVQKSGRKISNYILGGAMAGFMAQIVWNLARRLITGEPVPDYSTFMFGIAVGVVTAAYMFAFRFKVSKMLRARGKSPWHSYLFIAIAGAITLPLTVLLLQVDDYDPTAPKVLSQLAIGAVTAIGVAFGANIFSDADQPKD